MQVGGLNEWCPSYLCQFPNLIPSSQRSISISLTIQVFILSKLLILIFGYHHMMTTNIRYNSIYFFLKYLYICIIVTIKLHLIIELIQPLKGLNTYVSYRTRLHNLQTTNLSRHQIDIHLTLIPLSRYWSNSLLWRLGS